jgi:hypothetical protein
MLAVCEVILHWYINISVNAKVEFMQRSILCRLNVCQQHLRSTQAGINSSTGLPEKDLKQFNTKKLEDVQHQKMKGWK